MNTFQRLQIEFDSIANTLKGCTDDYCVLNYVEKLGSAIDLRDYDAIVYTLEKLEKWYSENTSEIARISRTRSPDFFPSNQKNHALIKELRTDLKLEDVKTAVPETVTSCDTDRIIFLSHKSDDKKYGHALRDFLIGLGVQNDQLVYTSHPMHKIPYGENIYDYLRSRINSKIFMIILWSNAYLDSPVCIKELGAAWVMQPECTNIFLPDFAFGNPKYHDCAIDPGKMGAVLNGDSFCRQNMLELKDQVQSFFGLENDEKLNSFLLDNFIMSITSK